MNQNQANGWCDALLVNGFTGQPITPQPFNPFSTQNSTDLTVTTIIVGR